MANWSKLQHGSSPLFQFLVFRDKHHHFHRVGRKAMLAHITQFLENGRVSRPLLLP